MFEFKKTLLTVTAALTLVMGSVASASPQTIQEKTVNAEKEVVACKGRTWHYYWDRYPNQSDVPTSLDFDGETYYLSEIREFEDPRGAKWSYWFAIYRTCS